MSETKKAEKAASIEETFQELEALIMKMENGDGSLEESFTCYEQGMKLVKECSTKIDKVEKQIMVLAEEGGNDES